MRMRLILQRPSPRNQALTGKWSKERTFDTRAIHHLQPQRSFSIPASRHATADRHQDPRTESSRSTERTPHRNPGTASHFAQKGHRHWIEARVPLDLCDGPLQLSNSHRQRTLLSPETVNKTTTERMTTLILNLKMTTTTLIKVTTQRNHQILTTRTIH